MFRRLAPFFETCAPCGLQDTNTQALHTSFSYAVSILHVVLQPAENRWGEKRTKKLIAYILHTSCIATHKRSNQRLFALISGEYGFALSAPVALLRLAS